MPSSFLPRTQFATLLANLTLGATFVSCTGNDTTEVEKKIESIEKVTADMKKEIETLKASEETEESLAERFSQQEAEVRKEIDETKAETKRLEKELSDYKKQFPLRK